MKEERKKELSSIAIGVRYRSNFVIADNFGSIVDDILYGKGSYFNSQFFPHILTTRPFEIVLTNEKKIDNKLTINASDIILDISFDESIKPDTLIDIRNAFKKDIIYGVLKKNKIREISRIGYVNRFIVHSSELSKRVVESISKMKDARDLHLIFSRKIAIEESVYRKDINDYFNVIHSIEKGLEKDELSVWVDLQRCYDPSLEYSDDIEYDDFLIKVDTYKDFDNWINDYYGFNHEK